MRRVWVDILPIINLLSGQSLAPREVVVDVIKAFSESPQSLPFDLDDPLAEATPKSGLAVSTYPAMLQFDL